MLTWIHFLSFSQESQVQVPPIPHPDMDVQNSQLILGIITGEFRWDDFSILNFVRGKIQQSGNKPCPHFGIHHQFLKTEIYSGQHNKVFIRFLREFSPFCVQKRIMEPSRQTVGHTEKSTTVQQYFIINFTVTKAVFQKKMPCWLFIFLWQEGWMWISQEILPNQ